jgi:Methylamine utilisation protein MauE
VNGFGSAVSLLAQVFDLVTGPAGYGIAIWVLAIVFVWSALAKLRRPALAAMAMNDFGILRRVRPGLGRALGAVELLLALSLITGTLLVVVLPVTAALLWFFVLLIARSLWLGKDFSCFCFGDADSRLSRVTLVRTTVLALLASALVVVPLRYAGFDQVYLLQAISAAALVGAIVLASRIPNLLRWNKNPYGLENTEVNR